MWFSSASFFRRTDHPICRFSVLLVLILGLNGANRLACQVVFEGTQIEIAGGANFPLSAPSGVALDGAGNVYIADSGDNQVLLVAQNGGVYSTPVPILTGLSNPKSVASDWSGNLFVADSGNDRILMLPKGSQGLSNATTLASGLNNPNGVTVDWSENVYITDTGNNQVVEIPWINNEAYGNAAVIVTGFNNPTSIAVDSKKTLYIADTGDNRTVKMPLTAAGYRSKQLLSAMTPSPIGVAVDGSSNLWTGSSSTGSIAESPWNPAANRYNSSLYVAGGFTLPQGMAIDIHGVLFIADAVKNRVMELVTVSAQFGLVNVGAPPALQTYQFEIAAGTTIGSTAIYTQGVAGEDFQDAGQSTCQPATYSVNTLCEINVNFTPLGPGSRDGAIVLYDPSGNALATAFLLGTGAEPQAAFIPGSMSSLGSGLSGPAGVAVDGNGNVFIADTGNDRIVEIPVAATGYGPQITVAQAGLSSPMGLAIDGANNLYIVSNGNDKVVKLPWLGNGYGMPFKVGSGLYGPSSVAVDAVGNVYIADTLDSCLWKLPWTGSGYGPERRFGNYTMFPYGIAVDGKGDIVFSSPYQNFVIEVPLIGGIFKPQNNLPLSGTSFPSALAVDGNADLYVVDTATNKLLMLPWDGNAYGPQITVASGFNSPSGIATDAAGNVYVADTGNNQVVRINLAVPGPISFPSTYLGSSSPPTSLRVQNTGNQTLNLSGVSYPPDFPMSGRVANPCQSGSSLTQGANCSVAMTFTPLSVNPQFAEFISLTDNNQNLPGSQQSVPLLGAGTGELAQTINFPSLSNTTYGAPDISLSATTSSGLPVAYQVVSGPGIIVQGQRLRVTGAGSIVVQATQLGNSVYQAATPVIISLGVNPAVLTFSANNVSANYGNIPSVFRYSVSGYARGESSANISGSASVTSNAAWNSGVGVYPIVVALGSLTAANYTFQFTPGVLTVEPGILVVSAVSVASTFGKPLPSLAWTLNGFKNGDTANLITGAPILTTAANSGSPTGIYPIVPSAGSLGAANYTFQMATGFINIHQATLTFAASAQSIVYGSAIPTLTFVVQGFAADDSAQAAFTGNPQLSTPASSGSPAGSYPITIGVGSLKALNYRFVFQPSTLNIKKAVLTVVPNNAQIIYGQTKPALTYLLSGFVNQDKPLVVTGSPILSACSDGCGAAGESIISSAQGTLKSANYNYKMGVGTLTILRAPLTIAAVSASATYGASIPKLTCSFQGLVNGDTPVKLGGTPEFTTTANSRSPAGTYPIAFALGTLRATNYVITFKSATLTIAKAPLEIAPKPSSMTYGATLPSIEYQLTGLQNGDTEATAISGKPLFVTAASAQAKVGNYSLAMTEGTLIARNYNLQFQPASISITPAMLVVTANNQSMKIGSATPKLTYTVTGFRNTDTIASSSLGLPSITTTANAKSAVGNYGIDISPGTMKASNYLLTLVNGTLQVTK